MKSIWKLAGAAVQLLELLAGIGTEDDGLAVDDVVDRHHEHGAGRQGDRDSADR